MAVADQSVARVVDEAETLRWRAKRKEKKSKEVVRSTKR